MSTQRSADLPLQIERAWPFTVDARSDLATAATSFGASVLSPDYAILTDARIASAHRHNQLVVPWTVDSDPVMIDLIRRGVDGVITDYPNQGRDVLGSLGYKLPRVVPAGSDEPGSSRGQGAALAAMGGICSPRTSGDRPGPPHGGADVLQSGVY